MFFGLYLFSSLFIFYFAKIFIFLYNIFNSVFIYKSISFKFSSHYKLNSLFNFLYYFCKILLIDWCVGIAVAVLPSVYVDKNRNKNKSKNKSRDKSRMLNKKKRKKTDHLHIHLRINK